MQELNARKALILKMVIEEFCSSGRPVGSKHLAGNSSLQVSAATIRNDFASLEKEGYLTHIFTSSGRIPTDKGYRFYVDNMIDTGSFSLEERTAIMDSIFSLDVDFEDLLEKTSHMISKLLSCIGIATSTKDDKIKHIDLVALSVDRIMVVLISDKGHISKKVLRAKVIDEDLSKLEEFLNQKFTRLNYSEFDAKASNMASLLNSSNLFLQVCDVIKSILDEQLRVEIHFHGQDNIIDNPEFSDPTELKAIFSFLNQNEYLSRQYPMLRFEDLIIRIGEEIEDESVRHCSLIVSGVKQGEKTVAAVGMLGPKRIDYNKAIASVRCVAGNLSHYLSRN